MGKIKGITVTLWEEQEVGRDPFGKPIKEEAPIPVRNVLVSPTSSTDVLNTQDLTGRTAVYTLAIPKGDTHNWENKKVSFFGQDWRSFGIPLQGMEHLVPLDWNMKVQVERFE